MIKYVSSNWTTIVHEIKIRYTNLNLNVSSNWTNIIDKIKIKSLVENVSGENITWSPIPLYPNCQLFDLTKYWNLEKRTTIGVTFQFYKEAKVYVSLHVEDKRRALSKRILKSHTTNQEGVQMFIQNSSLNEYKRFYLSLSQTRNLEMDPGVSCNNYPTNTFSSYQDCDESFVYNLMKNYFKIMPFWAANNLDEVTKSGYDILYLRKNTALFSGFMIVLKQMNMGTL